METSQSQDVTRHAIQFSEDVCDALRLYSYKGDSLINSYLRNLSQMSLENEKYYYDNKDYFDQFYPNMTINEMLSKFTNDLLLTFVNKIEKPTIVYRGLSRKFKYQYSIGEPSLDFDQATHFVNNDGTFLEITIPEDTYVCHVPNQCRLNYEYETILKPDSVFKIYRIEPMKIVRRRMYDQTLNITFIQMMMLTPKEVLELAESDYKM